MKKGTIVVLTGASSVGKSKIRELLKNDPDLNLFFSISVTTREKKPNEVDGTDYYFMDHKSFAQLVKDKELLEYTEFNGYYYGTPLAQIEFLINHGKNVLIEVEAQGVGQIKLIKPDAICFFILPKDIKELEKQIRERYKDDEASINKRITKAQVEMELASLFNYTTTNEDEQAAYEYIKKTIIKTMKEQENE